MTNTDHPRTLDSLPPTPMPTATAKPPTEADLHKQRIARLMQLTSEKDRARLDLGKAQEQELDAWQRLERAERESGALFRQIALGGHE